MRLPESGLLAARHARLRQKLSTLGLDALIVSTPHNVSYLSNHAGSAGMLVVTADAVHLLVDFRYQEAVRHLQRSAAACPTLQSWTVPASYDDALVRCVGTLDLGSAGFEAAHLTVARHDWLRRALTTAGSRLRLEPTLRVVETMRMVKDSWEIGVLREAASRASGVAEAAFGAVRAGTTEREVARVVDDAMRAAGYDRPAFETIAASGPNAALPHHRASDRRLADGDLVVLDFGGVLDGYCCDLTRTVAVARASAEAAREHGAVSDAQRAAIGAIRPGVATTEVDRAAREVMDAHGLGQTFGHGTGHGLGLDVHEDPRIARPRSDEAAVRLEPGMVFTIEPGAYVPGWGGVRIEDDVLVTDTGCELLTSVSRELKVC